MGRIEWMGCSIHHRDTESTEEAQSKANLDIVLLCVVFVSSVSLW